MAARELDWEKYCSDVWCVEADAGTAFRQKYEEAVAAIKAKHAGSSPEFPDDDLNSLLGPEERRRGWTYPFTKTEQLREFGCVFLEQKRFMKLVKAGDAETLQATFEDAYRAKGIDVNRYDAEGFTALHYAAWNDYPDVVQELLDNGAEPLQRDRRTGLRPIDLAEAGSGSQSGPNWNVIEMLKSVA
mmetsp:Transcript_3103/g.6991  ORF Transcript_3103/g.6991 Transcript_3103/m.6991 type:complete len:187 (+) Transcript_3103:85-645(+)|eukprot:CAMPEP_0178409548 /NCGR_PEP_ID=MMETSP0689_2-20121128/20520_1 /TAXON_ID=160604 /ORGANISM="Amphidinium massartii, Strain CS-259" /LENGTH=186 /DNA_ID=CAMNT_0020030695 /DNA_START=25 /DNA_END=585 /DNA_ORIENTATION=-